MPIPIILAAILELAEFFFGEAAVEAALSAAAEYMGIEGGTAALGRALEAYIQRWTPEAINTLESLLNPIPSVRAAGAGVAGAAGYGLDTFTRSAKLLSLDYSLKEQAIMRVAIRLVRRVRPDLKGADLKEYLLRDLQMFFSSMAHREVTRIPQGLSGLEFGSWIPGARGFWTFFRQVDGTIAIQKINAMKLSEAAAQKAAEIGLQTSTRIVQQMPPRMRAALEGEGVKKFLRLMANGSMAIVYEAPGCGEVELVFSRSTLAPMMNAELVKTSLYRYRGLW